MGNNETRGRGTVAVDTCGQRVTGGAPVPAFNAVSSSRELPKFVAPLDSGDATDGDLF